MHSLRFGFRRVIAITLVVMLVSNHTLAATVILPKVADQLFAVVANGWPKWKAGFRSAAYAAQGNSVLVGAGKQRPAPKVQETQADRDQRIAKVSIHPGDVTATVGETIQFTAVARDNNGLAIPGAAFVWSGNDQGRNRSMTVSQKGEFIARVAGVYQVRTQSGVHQDQVKVTVTGGDPRGREVRPQRVIDVSSRDLPKISSLSPSNKTAKPPANRVAAGFSSRVGSSFMPAEAGAKAKTASKAVAILLLEPTEWNETNIQLADDLERERGPPIPTRPSFIEAKRGMVIFYSSSIVYVENELAALILRLWKRI